MRAVILDLEGLESFCLNPIRDQLDELVTYNLTPPEQVSERISGFDIVITNKTPLSRESILGADKLKYICVVATGTNVVDKAAAKEAGIPISNCVAYGVNSVVQHVWSLILMLHTNLLAYHNDVQNGRWQKSGQFCFLDYPITELSGRNLGIIGYGNLGQGVARIAESFGMNVLVCQRIGGEVSPERLPFDDFIQQADVISLHCPLTEETSDLFTFETFQKMKPHAFLINAARGGIVNEADLAKALREGEIAGAATDVLTNEPPKDGNVLLDPTIPNLIVSPHIAWGSFEARQRIIEQTAENISEFRAGKLIRTV